jgi:SAM-dependent methyltransferase
MLRRIDSSVGAVLDIGCGTGFALQAVAAAFPAATVVGTDLFPEAFDYARRRVPRANFLQLDITRLPFTSEFDLVSAFDVVEHVTDDGLAFREVHRALRPHGWLLLTVPQHPALWSATDDIAHHKRRYGRPEMRAKLDAAGFDVVRMTSFVTLLMPMQFLARKSVKTHEDAVAQLQLPRVVDTALAGVMSIERMIIAAGFDLPFGGSLIVLARKR